MKRAIYIALVCAAVTASGASRVIRQNVETKTARVEPSAIGLYRGESITYIVVPTYTGAVITATTNATARWTVTARTNTAVYVIDVTGTVATNSTATCTATTNQTRMAAGTYDSYLAIIDGAALICAARSTLTVYDSAFADTAVVAGTEVYYRASNPSNYVTGAALAATSAADRAYADSLMGSYASTGYVTTAISGKVDTASLGTAAYSNASAFATAAQGALAASAIYTTTVQAVIGIGNSAGNWALAAGACVAAGVGSFAQGQSVTAGAGSCAQGASVTVGDYSFAQGLNITIGNREFAWYPGDGYGSTYYGHGPGSVSFYGTNGLWLDGGGVYHGNGSSLTGITAGQVGAASTGAFVVVSNLAVAALPAASTNGAEWGSHTGLATGTPLYVESQTLASLGGITNTAAGIAAAGGLTNNIAWDSFFTPSNVLSSVANGTLTVVRTMGPYLRIAPTSAVVITANSTLTDTNGVAAVSLDVFGGQQLTWVTANITNTTTITSNAWNSILLWKGYGASVLVGR